MVAAVVEFAVVEGGFVVVDVSVVEGGLVVISGGYWLLLVVASGS